jgi:hypothetical protein
MKRTGPLHRKTRLRRHGRRHLREQQARLRFRSAVLARAAGKCERCGFRTRRLDAHHIVPTSRAPGWPGLHLPSNGAALCRWCHDGVHALRVPDWAAWLKSAPSAERAA